MRLLDQPIQKTAGILPSGADVQRVATDVGGIATEVPAIATDTDRAATSAEEINRKMDKLINVVGKLQRTAVDPSVVKAALPGPAVGAAVGGGAGLLLTRLLAKNPKLGDYLIGGTVGAGVGALGAIGARRYGTQLATAVDQSMNKVAAEFNKDQLIRGLAGAGAGALGGGLVQYLISGDWKAGALAGAGVGGVTALATDESFRNAITERLKTKDANPVTDKPVTGKPAAESTEVAPDLNTIAGRREAARGVIAQGKQAHPADMAWAQRFMTADKKRAGVANALWKQSPEVMRDINKSSQELADTTATYATMFQVGTGRLPTDVELKRFTAMTTKYHMKPDEWAAHIHKQHPLKGEDITNANLVMASVFGGLVPGQQYAASKLFPVTAARSAVRGAYARVGGAQLKNLGGKASKFNPLSWYKMSDKLVAKKLVKQFGSKKAATMMAQRAAAKKLMNKSMVGAGNKLVARVGAKGLARGIPGMSFLLDIPELVIDPRTGDFTSPSRIAGNISDHDRLMEMRENSGTDLLGNKRNMLYNIGAGGLRGYASPFTTFGVAGKRSWDISKEMVDWGMRDDSGLEKQRQELQQRIKSRQGDI